MALSTGGCQNLSDVTGSIGRPSTQLPSDEQQLRRFSEDWGKKFEANPADKIAALTYARTLKELNLYGQEAAVLETACLRNRGDKELLSAYGKALVDAGRFQEALQVLEQAHTPERPDWTILSTEGTVADQMGDHAKAQALYAHALQIAPNEPKVLTNLGLSYALSKDLPRADSTLRLANQQPGADLRTRQNLALVLALEGKFDEAEQVSRRDLPPEEAKANIASIREMIAQSNTWREIQKLDKSPQTSTPNR